jgi:hypothetical protein
MRILKIFPALFLIPLLLSVLSTSCSKTGYTITNYTADSATQIIVAGDELRVNYELDQVVNESILATAISAIAGGDNSGLNIGNVGYTTISGAIIDTSHVIDSAIVRITYYGKNADGTKGRTGIVTIQLARDGNGKAIPWKTPGATMSITFEQYEVIVLATNLSLWINGTATLTNTSGGILKQPASTIIAVGDSLRDMLDGNISFTYNDNTGLIVTWAWNITHTRTFSFQNSILTSVIRGDSTVSGMGGISTTGTTRLSNVFYTQITKPIVQTISSVGILSEPLSGEKVINGIPEPITIDYGVNSSGSPVSGSPYGYEMTWIHSGGQAVSVVGY